MIKFKTWNVMLLFCKIIIEISASTHWIVTENGRIQSHLDSPFHMRKPYDILAFLDQDVRRDKIDSLYQNLVKRKYHIDEKWSGLEGATDIESRLYSQDSDCLKAGKLLSEIDLYTSIAVDGSDRDGIDLSVFMKEDISSDSSAVPDCQKYFKLDYSMFTFEHLTAMVNRVNLSMSPEHALIQWLKPGATVASFGHHVAVGLSLNETSWLHYNLGAIYWRIRGDAYRAVECGRRAVYFAPREFRDVALLNLASIFHQARYPGEAAIILHAAVDHAPHQPVNHFALGNVYAILSDYNRSIACYDNCLKLRPTLGQATTSKHAVLCHKKLETGLIELHEVLQGILTELHDYHTQREQWLKLQDKLVNEQAPLEAKLLSIPPETFSAVLANRGQTCSERGENSKLSCEVNTDSQVLANNLQMDITLSLQILLRNVEIQAQKISEQMAKNSKLLGGSSTSSLSSSSNSNTASSTIKTTDSETKVDSKKIDEKSSDLDHENIQESGYTHVKPTEQSRYPSTMVLSWDNIEFDSQNWPSNELCHKWKNINTNRLKKVEVVLPPENKGFQVSSILSSFIGLPLELEHTLPWYPPICIIDENLEEQIDMSYFPTSLMKQSTNINAAFADPSLKNHLMQYVNNGISVEAEIGQRILTAMKKKIGPQWLLTTLSSLYWRVRSNKRNALDCLKIALTKTPLEYRDVPLISLASIMYELGFVDEALRTAGEAFTINKIEPATNFLLSLLHDAKDNGFGAMYHIKQTLRVDPGYRNGDADLLLKAWACNNKLMNLDESDIQNKDQMCSDKDRSVSSEGVVCSANGEQCKTASIQCYRAERLVEDGDLMTFEPVPISNLLEKSNENCNAPKKGLRSLYSSLIKTYTKNDETGEGSGSVEPDQSQLESMDDMYKRAIHMRLALEEERQERFSGSNSMSDFFVSLSDEPSPKVLLHVYDKSGTYQLSPATCKEIRDADWISFTSMWWHSVAARNIDIGPLLKPLPDRITEPLVPFCDKTSPTTPQVAEHIPNIPGNKFLHSPEPRLSDWLALMTGDGESSIRDLGTRIAIALRENTTSWMLATAAAIYWRVLGNTAQAITCLKHALHVAPDNDKDIPMINLANVLQRVGFLGDALEVAKMALEIHPDYVVNQFTIGNIHTALGDFEKAITFYRTSLTLDPNFDAARNRLQAILCTLLFDESGSLRDSADIHTEN